MLPERIALVVDDSMANRKMTRFILEQQGLVVHEACNGQEAVGMAIERKYWVIFMDNQMPVMNGVEATKRICANCRSPIIALTGNSLDEDVQEFLSAGATQVLIKPCKKDKMLLALQKIADLEDHGLQIPEGLKNKTAQTAALNMTLRFSKANKKKIAATPM